MRTLILFCAIVLLGAPGTVAGDQQKEAVTIGVILPLTGSTASYGIDAARIAPLLQERLNAKSKGYSYRFIIENGQCGVGNAATTAAQKLINVDKARFLAVGCSGEMLQVGPIAQRRGVVANCFACSHRDIKNIGDYSFRTFPDMERGVRLIAKQINSEVKGPIALFTENNAFTIGIAEQLTEELGSQIGFSTEFELDHGDFKTLFTRARASDAEAYYLNAASPRSYQVMLRQLKELGISVPVYTYYMAGDTTSLKVLGEMQNGVRYFTLPDPKNSSVDFVDFDKLFLKAHPEGPDSEFLYRSSYDALANYAKAVEKVGSDPKAVRDHLQTGSLEGALGTLRYDANGDLDNIDYVVKEITNGN